MKEDKTQVRKVSSGSDDKSKDIASKMQGLDIKSIRVINRLQLKLKRGIKAALKKVSKTDQEKPRAILTRCVSEAVNNLFPQGTKTQEFFEKLQLMDVRQSSDVIPHL